MTEERGRPIFRSTVAWVALGVVSGMAGGIIAGSAFGDPAPPVIATSGSPVGSADVAPSPRAVDVSVDPSTGVALAQGGHLYVNRDDGYSFVRPQGWDVTTVGADAELRSPDGEVLLSFGPAPSGTLDVAAAQIVGRYAPELEGIEIVSSHAQTTDQGRDAWIVAGTGHDAVGRSLRFVAIAVDAPDHDQAIMVLFPSGPEVLGLSQEIESVISSYRVEDSV